MPGTKKTVLVFGTFDGLHEGHRFLLAQARQLGNRLIASVATDEVVEKLKGYAPKHHLEERLKALEAGEFVDLAVAGDSELGGWRALARWKPDIVALGYDQTLLEQKLREYLQKENLKIDLVKIQSYEPYRLHSRFLREK